MQDKIINELLEKSLGYLNNAEAFVSKELPIYVTELLNFKFWEHLTTGFTDFLFMFVVLATLLTLLGVAIYYDINHKENVIRVMCLYTFCSLLVATALSIGVASNDIREAYKVKYAPRVYLVDYIKNNK
ncbi:MAG: hypothetical protein Unbinned200contig1002_29 [Prokaryotic dsDNA virus sp.]|jgi:amino acid permease|nr:hypothetical protein [Flavobacteriaceae bacterium]QDP68328.1 MAG: hypothetical protein Unbinned200contig1002_29 [Prokaryotic dsDNA virus sp.]|tara:strand:- start:528 stop:914 length:387 start_codon:yes stop_codon:yes gene_type:complete